MEPAPEARKPLKWSRAPIIFDEEDHPGHTTGRVFAIVGLPNNSQPQGHKDVSGWRGQVESHFPGSHQQASDRRRRARGYRNVPRSQSHRSHTKGKITLPVTFGGELNYRTEKIVFDVVELPLPYNGNPG